MGNRSLIVLRNSLQRKYTFLTSIGNSTTNCPCAIHVHFDGNAY